MESVPFLPSRRGRPARRAARAQASRTASVAAAACLLAAAGAAQEATSLPGCTEGAASLVCRPPGAAPAAPRASEAFPQGLSLTGGPLAQGFQPPAVRPADGALLQTRLATPWASGYLDAVLSPVPAGGTRLDARGMGLQMRLPERGGELLLGRYVSGGAGLRPDLPIVGLRYSSRFSGVAGLPQGGSPALGGSLTLPMDVSGEPLGRLDFKLRELRGSAPVTAVGGGLRLLPRGASDVSLEAGLLAQDALDFERTDIPAAALTLRHGWLAQQTLSARAVHAGDSTLLAGLSEFRLMGLATAGATLRERGHGAEPGWLLAHEYQVQDFASRLRFEGLGGDAKEGGSGLLGTPSRRKAEFALSWSANPRSAFTLTAGERLGLDGERAELLSFSSRLGAPGGQQLSFGLQRADQGEASTQLRIDWRIPLERRAPARRGVRSLANGFGAMR